ncbi:MAG: DUF1653 domain-containing protein [Lachnospiraceae bacterium]|nr:DUF1653 domain-containing protein [Lachnospiraceae bacterium]
MGIRMEVAMKENQEVRKPQVNEIYRHFKGNLYKIVTLARDSETEEEVVVYQALYGDYSIYVRSLAQFTERLDKKRYPGAQQKYRFEPAEQLINLDWQDREILPMEEVEIGEDSQAVPSASQVNKEEPVLDPLLEAFLDADSYRERLNALRGLEHRITQEMINTMAIVLDLDIPEGTIEKRYQDLENSILTLEKYECNRLS